MTLVRMEPRAAAKPWGRCGLPPPFEDWRKFNGPIGEIIFDPPPGSDPELLVKFLFTEEKLSIQVHPDDPAALSTGRRRGKDEAWIVIAAEPGATIGFGLRQELTMPQLRAAVADGSIEQLVDWRPAAAGDCFYSPAGTIHAIGPGLSLVEIQQNCDVTYRLYDYGRPRELHVDEAIAVAIRAPADPEQRPVEIASGRSWLAGGAAFQVERLIGPAKGRLRPVQGGLWLLLLSGTGNIDEEELKPGDVWRLDQELGLRLGSDADVILAYPGAAIAAVWQPD